jgi:hypothetical protein
MWTPRRGLSVPNAQVSTITGQLQIVPIQHANLRGAAYYQQSLMEA